VSPPSPSLITTQSPLYQTSLHSPSFHDLYPVNRNIGDGAIEEYRVERALESGLEVELGSSPVTSLSVVLICQCMFASFLLDQWPGIAMDA
jgi:hypothetical protein